jgi:hypothetical protein
MKGLKQFKEGILFWEKYKLDEKASSLNLYFQFNGAAGCSDYFRYIIKDNSYSPYFGTVINMTPDQLYINALPFVE